MKSGKVVVVGDGACGKTCLLEVFKCDKFPDEYVPTVVDNFVKVVKYDQNKSITLALWDTAGQEDYDTIRPLSYRGTDLVLLCYTIENKKNLDNISSKWLMEIKNYCPKAGYFLIGLKEDLRFDENADKDSLVTTEEGKRWAQKIKALDFIECSALTRKNVDLVFEKAAKHISENTERRPPAETCWSCFTCFGCCG
ncbi:hypothetical protein PAEPH01_1617 [Pancytospora epiphaga]|nr:hypothetical protein PAEPH01_1617 [Pancytospora epiphaga]